MVTNFLCSIKFFFTLYQFLNKLEVKMFEFVHFCALDLELLIKKKLFLTKNLISARCGIWRCRCCRRLQIITLVSLVLVIEKPQTVNSFRESGLEGRQVKFDRNRQVPFVVDRMNEAQMFEENRPLNSTPTEADQENTKNHYLILHC